MGIYRIAGNFSKFETLTIFAIGHENVKVYSSGIRFKGYLQWTRPCHCNIIRRRPSANWIDRESKNRENSPLIRESFYLLKFPAIRYLRQTVVYNLNNSSLC